MSARRTTTSLLLPVLLLGLAACGDTTDAEDLAAALAERLTDAFDFDDGSVIDGPPPPAHGEGDYPQITFLDAPPVLDLGQDFDVDLETDFDRPEEVTGAMVWVKGAARHIDVLRPVDPATLRMLLEGRLRQEAELAGQSLDVYFSLYLANGETGLHETWTLSIPE